MSCELDGAGSIVETACRKSPHTGISIRIEKVNDLIRGFDQALDKI
ncbi:hypothetical protein JXA02_08610 [candidate division KSB1 bacterium]|nr:hypothetical protein [candidate division KSB1 bacterium]